MYSGLATFLGAPMQQTWGDLALWERVLNELTGHTAPLTGLIELGTGSGAFSLFLLMQCEARGLDFATFDRGPAGEGEGPVGRRLDLQAHCTVGDLWGRGGDEVRAWFAPKRAGEGTSPLLLFCDDGSKPREVATFGPLLRPGDALAVHDWGTEIGPHDMACMDGRLTPLAVGEMTAWWAVVG